MYAKFLTTLLGLAIVAVPAATPASQPEVKLVDLKPAVQLTVSGPDFALLLRDPSAAQDLSLVLPNSFTTLEEINQGALGS